MYLSGRKRLAARIIAVLALLSPLLLWSAIPAGGDAAQATSSTRAAAPTQYEPPVQGVVVDYFRAPKTDYGPGNRGWEYSLPVGSEVRAPGSGVVAFAGPVAGRLVISIDHPDGIRSSMTGLGRIYVQAGDRVSVGEPVGSSTTVLHLGFRRNGKYIDPALLLAISLHAVLVPIPDF